MLDTVLDPLYVDNHLLVAVKPAGLLSQEDRTGDPDMLTLAKAWIKDRFDKPGDVFLGLVHRLDRPASGVMVFARTSKAARRLSKQFRDRTVQKHYAAVVEGTLAGVGTWTDHIRKFEGRPEIASPGANGAKPAELSWTSRPLSGDAAGLSLADIRLKTGRPHQIRLQFSERGHPIAGDTRYGANRTFADRNIALHAYEVTIEHPTKREPATWCALPPETWPQAARSVVPGLLGGRCLNEPTVTRNWAV